MTDEFTRRIDAYERAEQTMQQNREDLKTFLGVDRIRFMQAEQQTRWAKADLDRAKDALCIYVLEHRAELEG